MEIDFLGLNSTTKYDNMEQRNPNESAIFPTETTGGVETSLSLSTTVCRPFCHTEILNFYEKRKWAEIYSSSGSAVICNSTPVFHPSATTTKPAGFLYNLYDKSTELSISSSPHAKGAENSVCIAGKNAPPRLICTTTAGYTPTVAMARRATLARFLEQRLHRMNRARTSHLMGKSLNVNKEKSILQR